MRKWLALLAALVISGLPCLAQAQAPNVRAVIFPPRAASGFTPSCSQSSAWLARATNVTLAADKTNYDNLICGLVTDGIFAKLDTLYVYATVDAVTAKLNVVQNAFNSTQTGSLTFTAYVGITGNASTGFLDTGFAPSTAGGQTTQNSATAGACVLSSRTTGQSWSAYGTSSVSVETRLLANFGGTLVIWDINSSQSTTSNSQAQGSWIITRTGASATTIYHNGTSFGTDTTASITMTSNNMAVFAENTSGTISNFTGDQQAWFVMGSGFTATDVTNFRARMNTYLSAYSVTGC